MIHNYTYLPIRSVSYGKDSIFRIGDYIKESNGTSAVIVSSASVSKTRFYSSVLKKVSIKNAEYTEITQHAPLEKINEVVDLIRKTKADVIISVGGGSVIDSAKAAKYLAKKKNMAHIAIPTTLSASEFSHIAGYTEEHMKKGIRDKSLAPQYVILDPTGPEETPDWLWRSSGVRALDHAVETLISDGIGEIGTTFALMAISKLFKNLTGMSEVNFLECQLAAWYSYFDVYDASMGLSHRIGKVIGAKYNIPHGITSCITLPTVMRYYAKKRWRELSLISMEIRGTGRESPETAMLSADMVEYFIKNLGFSQKLADFGVTIEELPSILSDLGENSDEVRDLIKSLM
ncbi:MAG: iron-containing alcohol dehydrogenase [Candidatus Thermoplasmatota archaeon]|nr:iron-containing alcohol dehydrogenase [Candidatus Thermoplasmatota archaeon]